MYKQLHLYLQIKKQHAFLLRNDDFKFHLYFSNQIEFNLKSINQELLLFSKFVLTKTRTDLKPSETT